MSVHWEKIENHAVHNSIKNLRNEISTVNELQNNPINVIEILARISLILDNFCVAFESSNKELVSISWLNDVSSACTNIKNHLTTYKGNKDANALSNNTISSLDTILLRTAYINCVKSAQNFRGAASSTEKYIKTIGEYNKQLDSNVEELKTKIVELQKRVDEHSQASTDKLTELKSNIDAEKQRLDAFAVSYQNQMSDDKKGFIEMTSEFKETFSASQNERKSAFDMEIEENANARKEFNEKANHQIEEIKQDSERVIKEYDDKFSAFEKQVENIVGIVNTNMFSYKYKEVADDAHKRAKFWHGVAVILMLAVSVFAVYAFVLTTNQDTNWVRLVAKIFATTTLVTGAAYSARQASKQEKVERYARKIEMELVAIDPFIASLDENRRSSVKEEISRKIFGNPDGMEINAKDEAYTAMDKLASIEDMVMSIAKSLLNKK